MNDDDDDRRIEYDDGAPVPRDGGFPGGEGLPDEVEIPWDRLSPGALRGVIEEFVTREGTEYGARDVELDTKVREVQRQLEKGEVVVLFHGKTQTVNLVHARDLRRRA